MKVFAGIVLFNPDRERLQENMKSVVDQVDEVVFFNNGGIVPQECLSAGIVLGDGTNVGIAKALNELCQYGVSHGYDWILTPDQDSVCPEGLIEDYRRYVGDPTLGMLCPRVIDRNFGSFDGQEGEGTYDIVSCITSGSMLRLSAWYEVGGFWDDLFIDMVDIDICWSLREKGYKILRTRAKALYHEIGHGKAIKLFGQDYEVYNHAPFRCYYMSRNFIAVGRKHHRVKQCLRLWAKRFLLINIYEKNRLSKDWKFIKGFFDGLRMSI